MKQSTLFASKFFHASKDSAKLGAEHLTAPPSETDAMDIAPATPVISSKPGVKRKAEEITKYSYDKDRKGVILCYPALLSQRSDRLFRMNFAFI
jgi:hypothetical protein